MEFHLAGFWIFAQLSAWWPHRRYVCPADPVDVPQFCPSLAVASQIFEAVLAEVRLLESRLSQAKTAHRRYQHDHDRHLVFRDVARPSAAPVETLIHEVHATVQEVDASESAVVLTEPATVDANMPLWISGHAHEVIHAEYDKVWLSTVDHIQANDKAVQRQEIGDLRAIFQAFHEQWQQRWCRHDQVPFTHWDAVVGLARRVFRPVPVPHLQVDVPLLCAETHRKKKRSATGLDGVSRDDLVQADAHTLQSLVNMYQRAECDGSWPAQLLAGKVHSLAKTESASTAGQYRPITVFGCPTVFGPASSLDTCLNGPSIGLITVCSAIAEVAKPQTFGTFFCNRSNRPMLPTHLCAGCRLTLRSVSIVFPVTQRFALLSLPEPPSGYHCLGWCAVGHVQTLQGP